MSTRLNFGIVQSVTKLCTTPAFFRTLTISGALLVLGLVRPVSVHGAASAACDLPPAIRAELAMALKVEGDPADFDKHVAPLLALRARHPNDLFAHELYQDAVQRYGIEGHLRKLTEDYQVLSMRHPDEMMYVYLYARSLIGRNTPSALQQINELLAAKPDFAPGHGSLAEIYASAAFKNDAKEKTERALFLQLCPGSVLQQRPGALPEPSRQVDEAERLLAAGGDPDRIVKMAQQGIRQDEWRLQRVRPFDWYTVDYKRQVQRELQAEYWRMWSIEVRCDRRAGRSEKAEALLLAMDQRAMALQRQSDPGGWDALTALASLYQEANQKESAARELESMQQFLSRHPDPQRAVQLQALQKQIRN